MVKQIFVNKILSDKEVSDLEGTWITEKHIKYPIINEDSDVEPDINEDFDNDDELISNLNGKNKVTVPSGYLYLGHGLPGFYM